MDLNKTYERGRRLAVEGASSSAEYTLSDYQGDVKRVLYTACTVGEGARFQNGDNLECSGVVEYNVIYLDTEGRITPISFTSDYELNIKCDGERARDTNTHTRVANFSMRLMGPRKFSAKALIECEAIVREECEYRVSGEGAELPLEIKDRPIKVGGVSFIKGEERELAEEIVMLDGAIEDEVEVLIHRVEPRALSYTPTEAGGLVRATLALRALISERGEEPRNYECSVELSSEVGESPSEEGSEAIPFVNILSSVISLNPSEAGVSVVASVIAECSLEVYENNSISILEDCFSTERGLDVVMGELAYTEHLFARPVCEKYTAKLADAMEGRRIRNLIYEGARVRVCSVTPLGKGVKIDGELQVSSIACEVDEDGNISYAPLKFDAPMSINVNIGCQIPENARFNHSINAESVKLEVNGDELIISSNIVGYISASCDKCCPAVSSISETGERFVRDPSVISVYYPTGGESLFEVAKKFHISKEKLARQNQLSEAVLSAAMRGDALVGVDHLFIK